MAEKPDNELRAMEVVFGALKPLEQEEQIRVLGWVQQKLGMTTTAPARAGAPPQIGATSLPTGSAPAIGGAPTPKAFLAEKRPKSDVERIVCLAYYLTRFGDTARFKTKDLTKLNLEAAQPRFSNAAFAVVNATNANYLAAAGTGHKQITAKGEATVEALPDRERVKAAIEAYPMRRKRKGNKKNGK